MIIGLIGESASGKTTIQNELGYYYGFERVISTTTRPKRHNESDDAYHFLTTEDFLKLDAKGKFVETSVYNAWHYALNKDDLVDVDNKCVVLNLEGIEKFKQYCKENNLDLYVVYIKVDRKSRLIKSLETREDIDESIRRNLADLKDFKDADKHCDLVVHNDRYKIAPKDIANYIYHNMLNYKINGGK